MVAKSKNGFTIQALILKATLALLNNIYITWIFDSETCISVASFRLVLVSGYPIVSSNSLSSFFTSCIVKHWRSLEEGGLRLLLVKPEKCRKKNI